MNKIINAQGLTILPRETVYEAAREAFYECLHNCQEGQMGRDFLKSAGVSKEEAVRLGLGFAADSMRGGSQSQLIQHKCSASIESLAIHGLAAFYRHESGEIRGYHFFRNCITRPILLKPEYQSDLGALPIGIIGVPIQPEVDAVAIWTPMWSDDRAMSDFQEAVDWSYSIRAQINHQP
jgi:hypothetical protein